MGITERTPYRNLKRYSVPESADRQATAIGMAAGR